MGTFMTPPTTPSFGPNQAETTGRFLVLFDEGRVTEGLEILRKSASLRVASTADFAMGALEMEKLAPTDAVHFDKLGIAVVQVEPEQFQTLSAASGETNPIIAIEPDRVVYALQEGTARRALEPALTPSTTVSAEYLQGYRDAVDKLVESLVSTGRLPAPFTEEETEAMRAQAQTTWGLQATQVARSRFSGRGVKVAVLDTGLDLRHPDFAGRRTTSQSFVPGQPPQDGHGHGTHVIGTACGPQQPAILPRYGIGYNAEIFVGKVLSNQGRGSDQQILAGINWAVTNRCTIVSMSLGAPVQPGQPFSVVFEAAARRTLAAGTLIIAAAGNESRRSVGIVNPVGHPANCPSIMAVGAVDSRMQIADFSNRGINPQGGQVDIAGPGVAVYSSWPMPTRYNTISGTSMATPHVSGIAALYAEANAQARGQLLWNRLVQTARRLILPSVDVGAGLVQAP